MPGRGHRAMRRPLLRVGLTLSAALALLACRRELPGASATGDSRSPTPSTSVRAPRAPRVAPERADSRGSAATSLPADLDSLVTATDSFDSLRRRYGDGNVVRQALPGGEGTEVPGWVLFPGDAVRRVDIYLDDSGRHPTSVLVGDRSAWTRSDGLRLGLDAGSLEALNGRAFAFSGFDWDYGGYVTDWNGGRLAHGGRFVGPVRLCAPDGVPADYPAGEGDFMSDLPAVRAAPPRVCELGVALVAGATH